MIIIDHWGKEVKVPVSGNLTGRRIREIRLNADDVRCMIAKTTNGSLKPTLEKWYTRFCGTKD